MLQKKACDLRGTGTRIKKASFTASENHARPPLPADSRKSQNAWERKPFLSLSNITPLFQLPRLLAFTSSFPAL